MRPLRISILLTGSALLLLAPKELVNACGFFVAPGEYRFWLLQPDLTRERDLTPFFFASTYLYKNDENSGKEVYRQRNVEEWMEQIRKREGSKNDVRSEDIDSLLNYTAPGRFLDHTGIVARTNSFARYLLNKKNSEWYDYLRLSKKVEQIADNPDPWDEGFTPQTNTGKLIDEAKNLYRQSGAEFIKMRTAFQLMRLYSFNGNSAAVCKVYDERIAPLSTNSWIKSAALYLKAIRGGLPEYDRLLAQVFDRGDYNRSYCLERLRSSNVDSLVRVTKNAHERTVLRAMKVFNYPGRSLAAIQQIYAGEPGYREIPFLLLREINKTEDWLLTGQLTGFKPAVHNATYYWQFEDSWYNYNKTNRRADQAYAVELNRFLLRMIQEQKNAAPALLHLYAAHVSMLTGDYAAAGEQLAAAAAYGKKLPANVRTQVAINRFLLSLETSKDIDAPMEKALMDLLHEPASHSGIYDVDIMKDQLILYTARKMIRRGNKVKGLMLLSRTRRALDELPISTYKNAWQEIEETAGPAEYDSIIAVLDCKHKTPFEKFVATGRFGSPIQYYDWNDAASNVFWDRNRLLDGKASWYLRNSNLQAALQTLRGIPESFWQRDPYKQYIGGNPFYLDIYRSGLYYGKRKANYNKKTIVEKMLELKSIAATVPSKRAESHFQLANAWYNMSWYGNNWLMVKSWWSGSEPGDDSNDLEKTPFNDFYYGCARARELYLLAMRETHDKKLAALCCFMAGECYDNQKNYLSLVGPRPYPDGRHPAKDGDTGKNPYLAELREKGVNESFYRELVKECAVYNDYIRGFDRAL